MSQKSGFIALLLLGSLFVAGCGGGDGADHAAATKKIRRATAWINPKSGSELVGSAIFINEPSGVSLQLTVENAPPGEHAVHLHEKGDCSAEDGTSAGGHWNPTEVAHGKWGEADFHLGDIGNLIVDDEGQGSLSLSTDKWSMGSGEPNDIMGKAVIVHAKADDFTTQPTGAAGGRIGCGVVEEG